MAAVRDLPEWHGEDVVARRHDLSVGDPFGLLFGWVEHAVEDMPNVFLALPLAVETGLSDEEQRTVEANLRAHADELGVLASRAAPNIDQRSATELG
jgi:hypothetical protein